MDAAPERTMNMASEIFRQLEGSSHPCPSWFVAGAGSSGPVVFGKTFSLLRTGVARMFKTPDDASIAAMRLTFALTGYEPGPSTETNLVGAMRLLEEMHRKGEQGALVTIICDDGKRYSNSYYDAQWLKSKQLNQDRWRPTLETFWNTGKWNEPASEEGRP